MGDNERQGEPWTEGEAARVVDLWRERGGSGAGRSTPAVVALATDLGREPSSVARLYSEVMWQAHVAEPDRNPDPGAPHRHKKVREVVRSAWVAGTPSETPEEAGRKLEAAMPPEQADMVRRYFGSMPPELQKAVYAVGNQDDRMREVIERLGEDRPGGVKTLRWPIGEGMDGIARVNPDGGVEILKFAGP